ncbi:MAG: hypothetical protein MJ141_09510, partial [Clostridia bacterium]|nr:hypothetical protein [Clostridia bacterium]
NHDTLDHGFDLLYTDNTRITGPRSLYMIIGEITVTEWKEKLAEPFSQEGRFIRFVENHDTASVAGLKRLEMLIGSDRMEAFIALTYTLNGVPFLWNGNEICDDSMTKTMGNRYFPGTNAINWAYAMTEKGRRRLKIVKTFNDLRKRHPELQASGVSLYPSPENVICYKRKLEGGEIKVFINLGDEEFRMAENGVDEIIVMNRTELEEHQIVIRKNGYMVTESKT